MGVDLPSIVGGGLDAAVHGLGIEEIHFTKIE